MIGKRSSGFVVVAMVVVFSAAAGARAPIPTPIGSGPKYLLPAASPGVERGSPVGRFECLRGTAMRDAAHVELFANRLAFLIPSGIGIARGCSYPVRTTTPTGVVEFVSVSKPTLADLFAVWGQPLSASRLAGFRGVVSAWVGGKQWHGAVGAIPLRRHAEIVVEIGGYIPPHTFFLFPTGT